ncbi:MAG: hypothetical protein K2M97_04305 [Muribaculaceae bacterium]|nr:hypothetical protein [Muribaculaceae bacterium]
MAFAVVAMISLSSCSLTKKIYGISDLEVPLIAYSQSAPAVYRDLDKSVRVDVVSSITSDEQIYDDTALSAVIRKTFPHYTFTPSVKSFAQDATVSYMQQMRFDVSSSADYCLHIDIKTFKISRIDRRTAEADVKLTYRLTDAAGETVVPTNSVNSHVTLAQTEQFGIGLGRAYAEALRRINWDRIADCLKIARTAKQEKNAQVTGAGDTALEHTVIRWYILSTPQGADVSWRVVSSTPDVANTNSNFVGTTPYESTEAFDIRGLTYNNSGNVQIEVSCERAGYLTQRKRFNLRQAIDQKEISAKFNLVKDE